MRLFISLLTLTTIYCASVNESKPESDLADLMVGQFATATTDPDNNFTDRRIRIPALGEGEWLYYQLNTGVERKLYRQRVIQLVSTENGAVAQNTFTLVNAESFANIWDSQKSITKADLTPGFGWDCEQVWQKEQTAIWTSRIDPKDCQIDSKRRGRKIGIGARSRLSPSMLQQAESGYELDGTFLWGTPEGEWITLQRIKD